MQNFPMTSQITICERYQTEVVQSPGNLKVGISKNVRDKTFPINGLRITPESDTTGWYIWAGSEMSCEPDFFVPLHVEHLTDWCPDVIPYLGLPPGWRFLLAPDYEDVWFDSTLLEDKKKLTKS